jgi:hypothetical protein
MMISDIIKFLDQVTGSNAKLYFIIRSRNYKTGETRYKIMKAHISREIGEELRIIGVTKFRSIKKKDPEYIDYEVIPYSDIDYVEIINISDVPFILEWITATADRNLETIDDDNFNKVWGYIVSIENSTKSLFLFKKYTPKKLLDKGRLAMSIDSGHFEKVGHTIVTIDDDYDAAVLTKESRPGGEEIKVFIFNRTYFESLVCFVEYYHNEIGNKIDYILGKGLFDDTMKLIGYCKDDSRKLKKLARIIKSGLLDQMDRSVIEASINKFGLSLAVDKDGKIMVKEDRIWDILKVLDDDYVESSITTNKYESHAKIKR